MGNLFSCTVFLKLSQLVPVWELRMLWRDHADAQARLNLGCSLMNQDPKSHMLAGSNIETKQLGGNSFNKIDSLHKCIISLIISCILMITDSLFIYHQSTDQAQSSNLLTINVWCGISSGSALFANINKRTLWSWITHLKACIMRWRRAQYWRTKRGFAFFLFTGTEL